MDNFNNDCIYLSENKGPVTQNKSISLRQQLNKLLLRFFQYSEFPVSCSISFGSARSHMLQNHTLYRSCQSDAVCVGFKAGCRHAVRNLPTIQTCPITIRAHCSFPTQIIYSLPQTRRS